MKKQKAERRKEEVSDVSKMYEMSDKKTDR